jgi:hypothetical protein
LLDAIPFKTSFRFDMEIWLPFFKQGQAVNFAPATFFCGIPGAVVKPKPDPAAAKLRAIQTIREFEEAASRQ